MKVNQTIEYIRNFVKFTLVDFHNCWTDYPNVLIWCGVLGMILFWV